MKKLIEKEPLVPLFVDMGESVLLAVSIGDGGMQRFMKDDAGHLLAPTGIFGLAQFSVDEIDLKIRILKNNGLGRIYRVRHTFPTFIQLMFVFFC